MQFMSAMSHFFSRYFDIPFIKTEYLRQKIIILYFNLIRLRCNSSLVISSIFFFLSFFSMFLRDIIEYIDTRRGIDTNCLIPVSDTPSFAITRLPGFGIPIVEGMSVSLKCEVDSNPASTPIWQRGKWRAKKRNGIRVRCFAWFLGLA